MEAIAILRNAPSSPRKARLVADMIRGKKVATALNILKFERRSGSEGIEKLLLSAVANWEAKNPYTSISSVELYVKTIFVGEGASLKRLRTAPQGRGYRMKKRSHHVTLVVDALAMPNVLDEIVTETDTQNAENNA
jgi:large subunit ribosomal protein L22